MIKFYPIKGRLHPAPVTSLLQTTVHNHTYRQFRMNLTSCLWTVRGSLNTTVHRQNKQTPHRKASNFKLKLYWCEGTVLTTVTR